MKISCWCLLFLLTVTSCFSQKKPVGKEPSASKPGAYQTSVYLPLLKGKRVAVFANNTSVVGPVHLVDTLQKSGINIVKIFAPEHGFRGDADAGESVSGYTDKQTGIQVVSLYGKKNKPSAEDLQNVDVLLFDIQDVGVRFYTYQASLQYFMEAALEQDKPLLILDRPNPNGFYVDGPLLDTALHSFIGMQPVPIVYGMTMGEYAQMIAGEGWLYSREANEKYSRLKEGSKENLAAHIRVIRCVNYTHKSRYVLPVKPSPNLPDMQAVYWYPSTCLFEGTTLSEGRGTDHPFTIFGHPDLPKNLFSFTPVSNEGAKSPKWKDKLCYGWNITDENPKPQLDLHWLLQAYRLFPNKDSFFIQPKSKLTKDFSFNRLAGSAVLMQQIKEGKTEAEIRKSWQTGLEAFKKIRKKYLLYEDF